MKTVKKFFTAFAALLLVLVITGCVNPNDQIRRAGLLVSLKIVKAPTKTTYKVGESLDFAGMEIRAYRTDGDGVVNPGECSITGFDSSKPVESQTVTVSYTLDGITKSDTFTVKIVAAEEPKKDNDKGNDYGPLAGHKYTASQGFTTQEFTFKNDGTGFYVLKESGTEVLNYSYRYSYDNYVASIVVTGMKDMENPSDTEYHDYTYFYNKFTSMSQAQVYAWVKNRPGMNSSATDSEIKSQLLMLIPMLDNNTSVTSEASDEDVANAFVNVLLKSQYAAYFENTSAYQMGTNGGSMAISVALTAANIKNTKASFLTQMFQYSGTPSEDWSISTIAIGKQQTQLGFIMAIDLQSSNIAGTENFRNTYSVPSITDEKAILTYRITGSGSRPVGLPDDMSINHFDSLPAEMPVDLNTGTITYKGVQYQLQPVWLNVVQSDI